jgi:hypothetical protein
VAKKKRQRQAAAPSPPSQAELETLCRLLGQQGIRSESAQLAELDGKAISALAALLTQLAERQRTHPGALGVKISVKAPPGGWAPKHLLKWLNARERGAPIAHNVTFYSDLEAPTTMVRTFPSAHARRPQAQRRGAPRKDLLADILRLKKQKSKPGTRQIAARLGVSRQKVVETLKPLRGRVATKIWRSKNS